MRIRAFGKIRRRHCGTGGVWFIKIIITTLLIASSIAVQAAPVALKGRVVEATTKEPLQYANVVLLTAGDSAFVAGTVSGEDGAFEIEHVDSGKYILKASFVGYESTFKAIEVSDKPFDAGDIELSEAVALQEVVVTARNSLSTAPTVSSRSITTSRFRRALSRRAISNTARPQCSITRKSKNGSNSISRCANRC